MLAAIGLAESNGDATRKVKAGALEINNNIVKDLVLPDAQGVLVVRLGKEVEASADRLMLSGRRAYHGSVKENHGYRSYRPAKRSSSDQANKDSDRQQIRR